MRFALIVLGTLIFGSPAYPLPTCQDAKAELEKALVAGGVATTILQAWLKAEYGSTVQCLARLDDADQTVVEFHLLDDEIQIVYPVLPTCTSQMAQGVVRSIFSDQNVPLTALNSIAEIEAGLFHHSCSARIETESEKGSIVYSIKWDRWRPQVTVEQVDAAPK